MNLPAQTTNLPNIQTLWNTQLEVQHYGQNALFQKHLFGQYKLYVEMADRISARRALANTFFLSANTLLITVITAVYKPDWHIEPRWLIIFPLIAVLTFLYVWWRLILSYKQLNAAKYAVIGEYEQRLPSSPYWSAEWKMLGEGKDPSAYKPLTDVERWIPIIFAGLYLFGALVISIL